MSAHNNIGFRPDHSWHLHVRSLRLDIVKYFVSWPFLLFNNFGDKFRFCEVDLPPKYGYSRVENVFHEFISLFMTIKRGLSCSTKVNSWCGRRNGLCLTLVALVFKRD